MKEKVEAKRLAFCDGGGEKRHLYELTVTNVDVLEPAGENRFSYSSYNSSYWQCSGIDVGAISNFRNDAHGYINEQNVTTLSWGTQTWGGVGTFENINPINCSLAASTVCFDVMCGTYQCSTSPSRTATIGVVGGGSTTWNLLSDQVIYHTEPISNIPDVGAVTFYVTVDGDKWFLDRMRLSFDRLTPSQTEFKPTMGTPIVQATDEHQTWVLRLCDRHKHPRVFIRPRIII